MIKKIRTFLWRTLGFDYEQVLKVHDYVFLKNDKYSTLGEKTYDNEALVFRWTPAPLIIGKYCSIANNVRFIVDEAYHGASAITNYPLVNNLFKFEKTLTVGKYKEQFLLEITQKEGIKIGNDVWIGMGAYIMPGITIGNGVTVAANSVVTKDIPDYCIVAGVPAKIIKMKYDPQQIDSLNRICWWDWEETLIKDRIQDFYNLNVSLFIKKYLK
jgi:virginiamycin A acetyltransferase